MAIYNPGAPRRLPLSRREKLIRAVGAIVLLGTTAWLLANWGSLPVRLPSHYGFSGEIDGWSGRGSLGLLLGIGWGVWLLLAVTRYFPRGGLSGLPVTDRSPPCLYCLMGEMLTVLQLVIALIFAFLSVWPLTFRALARVVVACVPGQPVRKPGLVSLAGSPAGTHPAQGVKPLHGNAVL